MVLGKRPETPPLAEPSFRPYRGIKSEEGEWFAFEHISIPEVMQLGQRDIRVAEGSEFSVLTKDSDGLNIKHGLWILLCVDLVTLPCLLEVVEEVLGVLLGHLDTFGRYRATPLAELEEPGL
jgi:hypothetical protein